MRLLTLDLDSNSMRYPCLFILGPGYIGGSVLTRILKHSGRSNFHITALVRSAEKGEKLKSLGVDATILGSYSDEKLGFLTEAVSQSDVVFAIVRLGLHFFSYRLDNLLVQPLYSIGRL